MATATAMLETYPRDFNVQTDVLARCIDECYACAETCTLCADDCLSEPDVAPNVRRVEWASHPTARNEA